MGFVKEDQGEAFWGVNSKVMKVVCTEADEE